MTALPTFAAGQALTAADLNAAFAATRTDGAWTAFAPTFSANFTLGNATHACAYYRSGNLVVVKIDIAFGSTTAITAALPVGDLPITAAVNTFGGGQIATYRDVSASADYDGIIRLAGTSGFYLEAKNSAGANDGRTGISSTVPFTWATGDIIEGYLMYEAA